MLAPNVDVTWSWKPSGSVNSGCGQDTFTNSSLAASRVWFSGQNSRVGDVVSEIYDILCMNSFLGRHYMPFL